MRKQINEAEAEDNSQAMVGEGCALNCEAGFHAEVAEMQAKVDEARVQRARLTEELHNAQQLQKQQRAGEESARLSEMRRELTRLQVQLCALK